MIRIVDPNPKISKPSDKEKKIIGEEKLSEGYRLACQVKILGNLRVFLTDSLMQKGSKILVDADLSNLGVKNSKKLQPIIRSRL